MKQKELVRRGNIIHTQYKELPEAGCYLANGRFGTVMGGLGLNMSPQLQERFPDTGRSQYTHMMHWGRFHFLSDAMQKETTADYILPLFRIYWEQEPEQVREYEQCQDFYDGMLDTCFTQEDGKRIRVSSWLDMEDKNLAGISIDLSEGSVPVRVSAITDFVPYAFLYRKRTAQTILVEQIERQGQWCLAIECEDTINHAGSRVYLYSTAPVEPCENGLRIQLSSGKNDIFISYGEPVHLNGIGTSRERTAAKWHALWEKTGWFDFPEEHMQQMWIRSMAYMISSYGDDCGMIQPTNGLTGNMFPFHFVQDLEYIAPALMMSGHVDIVKRWVEKFAGEIEEMKVYAGALWPQAKGIYPPWELPYGGIRGYHTPSVPVMYCYEPHNVGYLCRMAKEAAEFVNDSEWTRKNVYPLIRECANFYLAFCKKEEDGLWHMEWYPCIGQDEAGGRNKKDYLCSIYSAKYCFQALIVCGLDQDGICQAILKEGLAFDSLLSERGIYHTCHGADDFGRQKHPVQLDGLSYFPVETEPVLPEKKAYQLRHQITEGADIPFYYGWTLPQLLLTGSNLGDSSGWNEDWGLMRASNMTDSDWVQIYETTGQAEKSFYITSHGMVAQSLIRNYVNDYWGRLDIASCPVGNGTVSFGNIRTRLGVTVSGTVDQKQIQLALYAQKNCEILVCGEKISLRTGETAQINKIK